MMMRYAHLGAEDLRGTVELLARKYDKNMTVDENGGR